MPSHLRLMLLSAAALALAASSAAPVLAAASPAVHHDASTWSVVSTPDVAHRVLSGLSCASPTACVAVGSSYGEKRVLAESWNGKAWSAMSAPNRTSADDSLNAVSCASASACIAVGVSAQTHQGGKTLVESWNGKAWSIVPSPTPSSGGGLTGVSCLSATACVAVGTGRSTTLAESWNGKAWSIVPTANMTGANDGLDTVSCTSAKACTAVGSYANGQYLSHPLAESWNGKAWSIVSTPNAGSQEAFLYGVSCVSAADCIAVGTADLSAGTTLAESWNGKAWSVVPSPNQGAGNNNLYGVSCVSATSCTAVGSYGFTDNDGTRTLAESWNGKVWSLVSTPNQVTGSNRNSLAGISCVSATACNAVGSYQQTGVDKTLAESNHVTSSTR